MTGRGRGSCRGGRRAVDEVPADDGLRSSVQEGCVCCASREGPSRARMYWLAPARHRPVRTAFEPQGYIPQKIKHR